MSDEEREMREMQRKADEYWRERHSKTSSTEQSGDKNDKIDTSKEEDLDFDEIDKLAEQKKKQEEENIEKLKAWLDEEDEKEKGELRKKLEEMRNENEQDRGRGNEDNQEASASRMDSQREELESALLAARLVGDDEEEQRIEAELSSLQSPKSADVEEESLEDLEGRDDEPTVEDEDGEEEGFESFTPEIAVAFKEALGDGDPETIDYWEKVQRLARDWGFEKKIISSKDAQKIVDQAVDKEIELRRAETENLHREWEAKLRGDRVEEPQPAQPEPQQAETHIPDPDFWQNQPSQQNPRDRNVGQDNSDEDASTRYQRRLVEIQQKSLEQQELQLKRGIFSFTENELSQVPYNNLENQNWYLLLSKEEKTELSLRNKMLKALESKRKGNEGMKEFMNNLRLDRRELATLSSKEGFRMALSTMVKELFERDRDGLLVLKTVKDSEGNAISIKEIGDIKSQKVAGQFDEYRRKVVNRLAEYLGQDPSKIGYKILNGESTPDKIKEASLVAAEGYVASAWNLLSVGLAVESGDTTRKMTSTSTVAMNTHWRRLIHPRRDAVSNWIKNEVDEIGTEESLFNTLGEWTLERITNDPNFREDFIHNRKGTKFFLERTVGSMFDHTRMKDGRTLTDVLFESQAKDGMYDNSNLDFNNLESSDIGNEYKNKLDSVYKIQERLYARVAKKDKDYDENLGEFIEAVNALQGLGKKGDMILDNIYSSSKNPDQVEDQLVAAIASVSGGFVKFTTYHGKTELVLNITEDYDGYVEDVLTDDTSRMYKILGINPAEKQKIKDKKDYLRNRLNAYPVASMIRILRAGYMKRNDILEKAANLRARS